MLSLWLYTCQKLSFLPWVKALLEANNLSYLIRTVIEDLCLIVRQMISSKLRWNPIILLFWETPSIADFYWDTLTAEADQATNHGSLMPFLLTDLTWEA